MSNLQETLKQERELRSDPAYLTTLTRFGPNPVDSIWTPDYVSISLKIDMDTCPDYQDIEI